jgi:excisionase family DNA binding protein
MLVGIEGPGVVISARTAAWLERYAGLTSLRVRVRGTDPDISRQLEEIRYAAMAWRGSATGSQVAAGAEPPTQSGVWLTSGQAASLAGVSSRAIRKAISTGRLSATAVDGRYRISREDLEHYRAARAA